VVGVAVAEAQTRRAFPPGPIRPLGWPCPPGRRSRGPPAMSPEMIVLMRAGLIEFLATAYAAAGGGRLLRSLLVPALRATCPGQRPRSQWFGGTATPRPTAAQAGSPGTSRCVGRGVKPGRGRPWETPWGPGRRPGWHPGSGSAHVDPSTWARTFDIHGGGPGTCCSRITRTRPGRSPVRWVNGFARILACTNGPGPDRAATKMSKSVGNLAGWSTPPWLTAIPPGSRLRVLPGPRAATTARRSTTRPRRWPRRSHGLPAQSRGS